MPLLMLATLLGACGDEAGPCGPEPQIVLGSALWNAEQRTFEYLALSDGGEIEIVPGLQGLQHVWIMLRLKSDPLVDVFTEYLVARVRDNERLSDGSIRSDLRPALDASAAAAGWLEIGPIPAVIPFLFEAEDEELRVTATITDQCGRSTTVNRRVVGVVEE